ncbi:MAG: hypothetical protein F6J90_23410 [Moorea sp. SIOASIH]|nr:hypothetical protein [Moorena sp. SIOASIH]
MTLWSADFHTTEFDQDYDVVLVSAILRHISPEQCLRLLSKAYDALLPGGLLIVQEFINPEDNPKQSLRSTMMELYLMIGFHSESGNRSKEEIALWLEKTGFKNIKVIPLPTQTTLILGEKP